MTRRDDRRAREAWLRRYGAAGATDLLPGDRPASGSPAAAAQPRDLPHAGPDWVPLGPTTATGSGPSGRPPITGRVRSLACAPGGQRAYAATAGGGVWMTLDAGDNWVPLDPWRDTPDAALVPFAGGLSLGAIGVRFGNTVDDDVVFAGLGEPRETIGTAVRRFGRAVPGTGARVWTDEAVQPRQVYRLLVPPPTTTGSRDRAWLASTQGLQERPAAGPFAAWTAIPLPVPFSTPVGTNTTPHVTDVVLLPDGATEWLYVAVLGRGVVRIQLAAGSAIGQPVNPCTGIAEPAVMTAQDRAKLGRISLAAAEDGNRRVYALVSVERGSQRARLFRLAHSAANAAFARVTSGVPTALWFVDGGDQGHYDNTVAVVPQPRPAPATPTDEVVIAGSAQKLDGQWQAAVHRGRVHNVGAVLTFTGTVIGRGAHPDVHCAVFNRLINDTQDNDDLWLGTDGGVFRSQPTVDNGRFQPAHGGMAAIQLNYVAQHPTVPAFLLGGTQDNGMVIHTGEPAWRQHIGSGDAGGVAVDPTRPRWMWQFNKGALRGSRPPGAVQGTPVAFPPTTNATKKKNENKQIPFYLRMPLTVVPPVGAGTPTPRLAFASHRVWTSNDWGATWRSQPSNTNPLTTNATTLNQADGHPIEQLAWASPTNLLLATDRGVYQITGIGTAAVATVVLARQAATANRGFRRVGEPANAVPPAFATTTAAPAANVGPLPPDFRPTAIGAVDAAGTTMYLGISTGTALAEILWFLRTGPTQWVPTTFRAFLGGRTRIHAVLVDPRHPEDVYVATDVGVYRGIRTDHPAAAPTWAWSAFSFGLPEASTQDLALWDSGGVPPVRLLRAVTFGRGAWEIDLERATGRDPSPPREPEVFLRISGTDDGRRIPNITRQPDPLDPTLPTAVPPPRPSGFVESPDIAVVRARARTVRPWPAGALSGADRRAWRIAAATWGHRLTPGTGAFGAADKTAWQAIQRERAIPLSNAMNERTWRATFKGLDVDPDHVHYLDRYGREVGPPPPPPPAGSVAPPRWQVADPPPGVNRVLVHVRTRGPLPVPAGRTEVVVLWQVVAPVSPIPPMGPPPAPPSPGVVLPQLPARWRQGVRTRDLTLLNTDGWAVAGAGFVTVDPPVLTPPPLDPENPRVVGIDLVLTGRAIGDLIALFAIVRCTDDLLPGPAQPGNPDPLRAVQTAVMTENRTALRVIQIRDPTT